MLGNKMIQRYLNKPKLKFVIKIFVNHASTSYSPTQIQQMNDEIILVDQDDNILGAASKRECHARVTNQNDELNLTANGMLHRAFSVFLFNSRNELLLQQRSSTKITFPNYFTNSCCSHPRFNDEEMDGQHGIKVAAQRRMDFELGVQKAQLPLEMFNFLTRIHYSAKADDNWGEHELDYVLFCRTDISLDNVNSDEVQNVCYMNQKQLKTFLRDAKQNNILITPWFEYICKYMLFEWWDRLDDISQCRNDIIHRAGVR